VVQDVADRHVAEVDVLAYEYLGERSCVEQVSASELDRTRGPAWRTSTARSIGRSRRKNQGEGAC
jgi:hypothetical protein